MVAETGVGIFSFEISIKWLPLAALRYPKKSIVPAAHLIFSTAAESTSSLYHSPNALGVLSQRATLVGLITQSGKPTLATKANKNSTQKGAVFCLVAETGFEPATSVLIASRRLAVPEKIYRSRSSLDFFDRCGKHLLAVSFPECARGAFPTSYARRSHNPKWQANACHESKQKQHPKGCCFLFGCGDRIRTCDLRVMSPTSYQLLYPAILYFYGLHRG